MNLSRQWAIDAAERVFATFIEAVLAAFILAPTLDLSTTKAVLLAAVAAASTLKTIISGLTHGSAGLTAPAE